MAYTKQTWHTGDTITAEMLNHMEDGISVDNGYTVTRERQTILEESVTTEENQGGFGGQLAYSGTIDYDSIIVTLNGTEYVCSKIVLNGYNFYGGFNNGPDFSEYPFLIAKIDGNNMLFTETAGTYTVKVELETESVTVTDDFALARGYAVTQERQTILEESVTTVDEYEDGYGYGRLTYSDYIDYDSIIVTFDGTEYVCAKQAGDDENAYGAPWDDNLSNYDWSSYPFGFSSEDGYPVSLNTQTTGAHTIKIESNSEVITTTEDFNLARGYSVNNGNASTTDDFESAVNSCINGCDYIANGTGEHAVIENNIDQYDGEAKNVASGAFSHAEGNETIASGNVSHAEGGATTASGDLSHAEGQGTTASGLTSHAEGQGPTARGQAAHAEGMYTIANLRSQHVFGEFNIPDSSSSLGTDRGRYVEIVGKGTAYNARSNARTLDWDGNEVLAGGLTVGAAGLTIGSTTLTEAQLTSLLALLQ